jgi:hypothetical protein
MRPRFALLPALFSAIFVLLGCPPATAREYPLFKLNDPQQAIFRYGAFSDQLEKGASTARISVMEAGNGEKYPFARAEVNVQRAPAVAQPYAGIRFWMESARMPDEEGRLILRVRASKPDLDLWIRITDVDGVDAWFEIKKIDPVRDQWRYLEVPFEAFKPAGKESKLRPFLKSISVVCREPGQASIDVALVALNAP